LNAHVAPDDDRNLSALQELREYLAGDRKQFSVSLDIQGTPFQQSVWKVICEVPYGETVCYKEIAVRVGRPKATRATGQAIGANPVPIFIPCHRIVGKHGDLTGYGGGLPLKERFLALEHGSLDL
jgi:O-6-methylguanine DNA methyltransferase